MMEYDPIERKRLFEASERHKLELTSELNEIGLKTDKFLTNALIIGGSLALTYFVLSQLTAGESKKKKTAKPKRVSTESEVIEEEQESEPTLLSQMGSRLVDQATLLLLDLAKEKLSEYIQSKKREDS